MTTRLPSLACALLLLAPIGAAAQDPVTSVLAGMGAGGGQIRNLSAADGSTLATATPFGAAFHGGVRVASGDINGDGTADFIAGAGFGSGQVRVLDGGDLSVLWTFTPFGASFHGGVYVASGDIDGDSRDDVIVGAGVGGGQIRVYSGVDHHLIVTRTPFGGFYHGGVTVAAGDIDGDTRDDLVAGTAIGGAVRVIDGVDGSTIGAGFPYSPWFFGGVNVAAGDVNADGRTDVITGPGLVLRQVRVFSGLDSSLIASVTPYPTGGAGGVTVAAGDVNGDNHADIITGPGPGTQPRVKIISGLSHTELISFLAFSSSFHGGVFVAAVAEADTAPVFTSDDETTFQVGVAGTFDVTTTGGTGPVALTVTGTLPSGVTFTDNGDGTGTLAGTPDSGTGGEYPLVFHADDGDHPVVDQNFLLTVNDAPAITSANNTGFDAGASSSFTVTSTGFPTPALNESGALPTGISFTDNGDGTGDLTGTPTQSGVFPITFTAANGVPPDAVQNFTLTVACPAITVSPSGALADGLFGVPYGPVNFMQTGSTGSSITWTAMGLPLGLTIGTSSGVLSGTPNDTVLNAAITVTATDEFGCQGSSNVTLTIRPLADNETYNGGVGGTQFAVGVVVATPNVFVSDNVTNGDAGPGALSVTFGPAANGTVVEGGTEGTFVYTPNLNFAGPSDSFIYTLTDGNGITNTATVTINLSGLVWYVNSLGPNGDGRSHSPFINLIFAGSASSSGSIIYVHTGGIGTFGLLGMDANQTLHGAGAPFVLNSLTIPATGAPNLADMVTLNNNTIVTGVNSSAPGPAAFRAIGLSGPVAIDLVNTSGGSNALSLTNVSGSVTVTNSSFVNAAGAEVLINGSTGAVSIGATISNNAGRSVDIQNRTGGTVTFGGPIGDTAMGILLNNNGGSTVTFAGGLNLVTGANPAFTATNGGIVTATQNNTSIVNTIATTTGTALNVSGTGIGASGLTFRSISANGAANGILLNATGSSGGLSVTGTGGAGTGGTIQNTSGDGISLTSTSAPSFSSINILTTGRHGIHASGLTAGLTLSNSQISGAGNGDNEHGINIDNSTGTVSINGSAFTDAAESLIDVDNTNADLTLNVGSTAGNTFTHGTPGAFTGNGILLIGRGSTSFTVNVSNNQFTNVLLSAVLVGGDATSAGTHNITIDNNDTDVTVGGPAFRASNFNVQARHTSTVNIFATNNDMNGGGGGSIQVGADEDSTVEATITGNTIYGGQRADGILAAADDNARLTLLISGNSISDVSSDGMEITNFGATAALDAVIENNQVTNHNTNTAGNAFLAGIGVFNFGGPTCVAMTGNNVQGTPSPGIFFDYSLVDFGGTMTFEEVPDLASVTSVTADYILDGGSPDLVDTTPPNVGGSNTLELFGSIILTSNGIQTCQRP